MYHFAARYAYVVQRSMTRMIQNGYLPKNEIIINLYIYVVMAVLLLSVGEFRSVGTFCKVFKISYSRNSLSDITIM